MAIFEDAPALPAGAAPPAPARAWPRKLGIAVPTALLIVIVLGCFLGPVILPIPAPTGGDVLNSGLPGFSPGHLLGTDGNGNDVVSRILYGGRNSLIVAVSVNVLGVVIGGLAGALSGYAGGLTDTVIMRVLDIFIAFPALVLIIAVAQSLGPSQVTAVLALTFFSVPAFARVARAATLSLRERPFLAAAHLCGTSRTRTLLRHLVPNIFPQLVTFATLGMGLIIVLEGALSFLGLGIPAPAPSWGNMIADGQASLSATPWLVLWPSAALFVTVLSFNLLGDALRGHWSSR